MATTTALSDGGYVEYWVDPSGTSDPDTLHVQKHNADGSLAGPEYIHATRDGSTVLGLSNGGYVVGTTESAPGGIVLVGEVFAVNGGHLSEFRAGKDWSLAASDSGGFLVTSTFTTNHNFTQPDGLITLYDNTGQALTATGHAYSPSGTPTISTDASGVFHVAWTEGSRSHDLAVDPHNPPNLASPATPTPLIFDDVAPNTGAMGGGWTNDNTPTFRIPVTEAGYVAVGTGGVDPGVPRFEITGEDLARGYKDIVLGSGAFSEGRITIWARVEDADGMISGLGQMQITIDTQAPGQPTVSHVTDDQGAQQGEVANGGTMDDTTPTFQITLAPGSHVGEMMTFYDGGAAFAAHPLEQADLDRGYVTATLNLADGHHSITTDLRDQAGNASPVSAAFEVTVQADATTDHQPRMAPTMGSSVNESALPTGSAPDAAGRTSTGTATIESQDGFGNVTVGGQTVFSDGAFTAREAATRLGVVSITGFDPNTGTLSYTYTLTTAEAQSKDQPGPYWSTDSVGVSFTDSDGDSGSSPITWQVIDDVPKAHSDTDTVAAGATATGNVITDAAPGDANDGDDGADAGADRPLKVVFAELPGHSDLTSAYGTLTLDADGSYTFQANADAPAGAVVTYNYYLEDSDGSRGKGNSEGQLTITIGAAGGGSSGGTINSPGPGSTINGTAGSDTINASQGPDVITTGGGSDVVAFHDLPWNAGHITDFAVGADHLDLSAIFQASGYTGADPVADGRMTFQADGAGGTRVYFDHDQTNGGDWPFLITTLDHVSPSGLTWAQLTATPAGPPPQGQTVGFATTSISQNEGDSGVTHYRFVVTRSGDTSAQFSLHWTGQGWGNNQPTADDFAGGLMPVGSLTFAAGETSKVLDIGVVGDTTVEQDEGFRITIDGAAGATISNADAFGTIINDDTGDTSGTQGQVYTAQPGATVVGGAGDDTINASQGPDRLTGGGGNDDFVFRDLPWGSGHITDFVVGSDKLDLSAIFQASGYSGSDPVADGRMRFEDDGHGDAKVYFDHDQLNGGDWPFLITTLDHVSASGLTWAALSTGGGSSGGGSTGGTTSGQVITSHQYGDTLTGGAGDDTLNAGQGPDLLSGNGGADHFVWNALPWRPGAVTDFTPGVDKLDLRALFSASGYAGTDPIADHHLQFRDDGQGNTAIYFDRDDPNGGDWPFFITTLQGVTPGQIGPGDWLFR